MLPLISAILPIASKVIERLFPDPTERAKAELELTRLAQEGQFKELDAAMQVIVAEAKSEHWLAATWRPIIMLIFGVIIAHNYILAPYLQLFGVSVVLDLPPDMWDLVKIGLGGYVVGRSGEKMVKAYKSVS